MECAICNGRIVKALNDYVEIPCYAEGELEIVHKDCLFDEPRAEAPDTSDDGDGFDWEDFWTEREERQDAEREDALFRR